MKRGLAPFSRCSALATTRRLFDQLSRVAYTSSLNTRAGWPVAAQRALASASSAAIIASSRALRARPNTYSTRLSSHQLISSSRAKPLSALSQISTSGQAARRCATTRATSDILPEQSYHHRLRRSVSAIHRKSLLHRACRHPRPHQGCLVLFVADGELRVLAC